MRILLVLDEPQLFRVELELLKRAGHHGKVVTTFLAFQEAMLYSLPKRRSNWDVVVCTGAVPYGNAREIEAASVQELPGYTARLGAKHVLDFLRKHGDAHFSGMTVVVLDTFGQAERSLTPSGRLYCIQQYGSGNALQRFQDVIAQIADIKQSVEATLRKLR